MTFRNPVVLLADLPHLTDITYNHVERHYAPICLGVTVIVNLAVVLGAVLTTIFWREARTFLSTFPGLLVPAAALLLMSSISIYSWLSDRVIRYALREHDLVFLSGVFWQTVTVQPLQRVQHVALTRSPLDKHFGLANLHLYSAGTGHTTFTIPGLALENAERIRKFVLDYKETGSTAVTIQVDP